MNIAALMSGVAAFAWFVFVGIVVLVVVRAARNRPMRSGGLVIAITAVVAFLLTTVSSGLVFINPQESGVVLSVISPKGYRETPLGSGLHWIVPFAENVVTYPISKQTYTMSIASAEGQKEGDDSISARTLDGQEVLVDASVIYAIDPAKVVQVHIAWQNRYPEELVRAQSRGIVRDVVSQYGVEQVYSSKRTEMTARVSDVMNKKLSDNGLILVDFVLRNISFTQEYSASIEQKQIAEQQAQQAKLVVESKKQEAEQARQVAQGKADASVIASKGEAEARLIQAEAEARSLKMLSEAIKDNPSLIQYLYINKLSPTIQTMLLPSNSPFLFPLPTTESPTVTVPEIAPTPAP